MAFPQEIKYKLRQDSRELGEFLGKWNSETETDSWTNWRSNVQPDTEGHFPRDNILSLFQLQAQTSSKTKGVSLGPADPPPCTPTLELTSGWRP